MAEVRGEDRQNLSSHLDSSDISDLAARSRVERWSAGDHIIRQGEEGDTYFILLDGVASVLVDGRVVNDIHPGEQFGEIALLHGVTRTADVVAQVPVVTLALQREDFDGALMDRFLAG